MLITAATHLDRQIKQVCPNAHGISIGRWHDKRTWSITGPVTDAERAAAQAIFDAFDKAAYDASQPQPKTREQLLADIDSAATVSQLKAIVRELVK